MNLHKMGRVASVGVKISFCLLLFVIKFCDPHPFPQNGKHLFPDKYLSSDKEGHISSGGMNTTSSSLLPLQDHTIKESTMSYSNSTQQKLPEAPNSDNPLHNKALPSSYPSPLQVAPEKTVLSKAIILKMTGDKSTPSKAFPLPLSSSNGNHKLKNEEYSLAKRKLSSLEETETSQRKGGTGGDDDDKRDDNDNLVLRLDREYTPSEIAEYIYSTGDEKGITQVVWEMMEDGQIMASRDDVLLFLETVQSELERMKTDHQKDGDHESKSREQQQ